MDVADSESAAEAEALAEVAATEVGSERHLDSSSGSLDVRTLREQAAVAASVVPAEAGAVDEAAVAAAAVASKRDARQLDGSNFRFVLLTAVAAAVVVAASASGTTGEESMGRNAATLVAAACSAGDDVEVEDVEVLVEELVVDEVDEGRAAAGARACARCASLAFRLGPAARARAPACALLLLPVLPLRRWLLCIAAAFAAGTVPA